MTFQPRSCLVVLLAASIAVPFAGCSDSTSFQPDASTARSDDAAAAATDGGLGASSDATTMTPLDATAPADAVAPMDATAPADAAAPDADALAPVDAGAEAATCDFGSAASFATQSSLDLFGQITYFAGGDVLPAGRYRVQYVDGCMKYGPGQDWTVQAYADGSDAFWLGATTGDKLFLPPATAGYSATAGGGGAYVTFDECVAANLALPPSEFDFAGGQLGVWLADSQYSDNMAGTDGRNPKWSLTLLGSCMNPE
jgi:hypothetical protein